MAPVTGGENVVCHSVRVGIASPHKTLIVQTTPATKTQIVSLNTAPIFCGINKESDIYFAHRHVIYHVT